MKRLLPALLLLLGSCAGLTGRMAELQSEFAATMQRHAEEQKAALADYQATVDSSLGRVEEGSIGWEEHVVAVEAAAKKRDADIKQALDLFKHDAKQDWSVFEDNVKSDVEVAKADAANAAATVVKTTAGVLGFGSLGDLIATGLSAFGVTMGARNYTRKKMAKAIAKRLPPPTPPAA